MAISATSHFLLYSLLDTRNPHFLVPFPFSVKLRVECYAWAAGRVATLVVASVSANIPGGPTGPFCPSLPGGPGGPAGPGGPCSPGGPGGPASPEGPVVRKAS